MIPLITRDIRRKPFGRISIASIMRRWCRRLRDCLLTSEMGFSISLPARLNGDQFTNETERDVHQPCLGHRMVYCRPTDDISPADEWHGWGHPCRHCSDHDILLANPLPWL